MQQARGGRKGRAVRRLGRGRRSCSAGRSGPACRGSCPANSRTPCSWHAPPVSTTRRPAILSKPLASSRSRTSSKVSSRRGAMMLTSIDFGTWLTWPSSSSPICGTAIVSRSSRVDEIALPNSAFMPLGMGQRRRQPARDVVCDVPAADRDANRRRSGCRRRTPPIVVVPPPMSITVTPRSISSSTRQARPAA